MRSRTAYVGDSLGVGTSPFVKRQLGGRVDANVKGGRSSKDGVDALRDLTRRRSYDRIVMDLGTNDGSAKDLGRSLRRASRLAGRTPLYVPTVNGRRAVEKNRVLRRVAAANGITVVDWKAQMSGDGIHATGSGYQKRARQVVRAMGTAPRVKRVQKRVQKRQPPSRTVPSSLGRAVPTLSPILVTRPVGSR